MSLQITELRVGNLLKVDKNIWTVEDIINGDSTWELYFKENPEYNHWVNAEPIKISNDWFCGLLPQNLNWNANAFSFLFCAMANINLKN